MLREQFPEEFARGRLYGSEAFPTDVASFYAARPGRSAFSQIAGREAGAAGGPRAIGGAGTPALNYEPVAAAPRGSFDASMMEAYRRGAAGSRAPGRPQAFRPEDFLAIEQGPLPTSRNAFEANAVMAQRRGMPSPAPAAYDYEGPAGPGPFIDRPRSRFDENAMAAYYRNQGKGEYGPYVPGRRSGPFREGDYAEYTPEEMGQGVALRGETIPMAQQGGMPAVRGGLPTFARGEYQAPNGAYGEFRDVTGNVLSGPQQGTAMVPYGEAANALRSGGIPFGKIAAGAAGVGLPFMAAYYGRDGSRSADMDAGRAMAAPEGRGTQQLPAIDVYGRKGRAEGMPMAESKGGATTQKAKGGKKSAQTSPKQVAPADDWEGNLNYKITQMFDKLFGQEEAERGRKTQQYYEQNP
jgi:hypothetical protein